MTGLSDVNPFVGPRPIQQGEALHGRAAEVRELYNQLQARRIVVLHSPSGAGKSSLVHAGLIPQLRADKFDVWRPIRVNVDSASFEGVPEGTNRYLLSALVSLEDELPPNRRRSPAELAKLGFLDYLESRPRRKCCADHSVVLLFDQFEEVLSVAPRAMDAKDEFFSTVGQALDTGKYWALFIIREDYLAALAPFRDRIPTQMSNTLRLDLLGLAAAREAAVNLSNAGGRSFPSVDKLIRDLSSVQVQRSDGSFVIEQGHYVEPVYLQVVCRRLWEVMPTDDLSIDEEDIEAYAGISKSLAGYYTDVVRSIAGGDAALERSIRDWVGTKLIVGGIRSQIRQEQGESGGLDNRYIQKLLDSYLVRTEQRAGANWFELSHDRLVEPVQQDNEAWQGSNLHSLQVQAKLWEVGGRARPLLLGADALPHALDWAWDNPTLLTESEQDFLELSQTVRAEEARARQRRRTFTVVLAVVTVAALALGGVAWQMRAEAEDKRHEAELARTAAEQARGRAQLAQTEAELARTAAEQAQTKAEQAQQQNKQLTRELLRQMFQVALRRYIEGLADAGDRSGEIEIGEGWTPLLESGGQVFAAANIIDGGGRLVAAGSDAVLSEVDEHGDSLFLEITVRWLLGDQARRDVIIVTQQRDNYERLEILRRNLEALGYVYVINPPLIDLANAKAGGVLIIDNRQWRDFSAEELGAVETFVRGGGGLLAVGSGRGWLERKPEEGQEALTLESYPMNRLFSPLGVNWTGATIDPTKLETEDASVRFKNVSGEAVNLLAWSVEGREEYYSTLDPGEIMTVRTSLGREWIVRTTADDRLIGEVTIDADRQFVSIAATALSKKHDSPRPKKADPSSGDKEMVAATIRTRLLGLQACYEKALGYNSRLSGKMTYTITIDGSGHVTDVEIEIDSVRDDRVRSCTTAKIKSWRFWPDDDHTSSEVTFSVSFG